MSTPGRRESIDFPGGGLVSNTPGLNDLAKGKSKPSWMGEQYSKSEASRGTSGFEGSYELYRDFDRQTADTTENLSPGNQHKAALGSERN